MNANEQLHLIETDNGVALTPRLIFNSRILGVCDVTVDDRGAKLRFRRNEPGYQGVEFSNEELAYFAENLRAGKKTTLQSPGFGCQHSWRVERSRVVDVYELPVSSQKIEFCGGNEA